LIAAEEKQDLFAEFLVNGILRGAVEQRYNAYVKGLTNGFLNADEVRSYENLNPIPDGSGQIFRVPLNLAKSDSVSEPPDGDSGGTPSTPGAAEPVEGRSKLNDLFFQMFSQQYDRLIRREEKTTKKTQEWRFEHAKFVAESLEPLLTSYIDLYSTSETERLLSEPLKRKIAPFVSKCDSELATAQENAQNSEQGKALRATRASDLWCIIQKEIKTTIGEI
jgi:hypothetical protein